MKNDTIYCKILSEYLRSDFTSLNFIVCVDTNTNEFGDISSNNKRWLTLYYLGLNYKVTLQDVVELFNE